MTVEKDDTGIDTPVETPVEPEQDSVGLPPAQDTVQTLEQSSDQEDQASTPELEYAVYDDENANAALTLLKDSGVKAVDAKEFFKEAIESRDPSKVDYAAIEKRLGKEKANLVKLAITEYYNTALKDVNEKVNAVFDEVGSEANWGKLHAWAVEKAKVDPEFKKLTLEHNKMFDLNTRTARAAAKELKEMYEADPKNKSLMVNMVQGDTPGAKDDGSTQITKSEYLEKMKVAQAKNDIREIERLRALRTASKQAGI